MGLILLMAVSHYSYESNFPATGAELFAYHERSTALQRLTPPWQPVKILNRSGGIENGATVDAEIKLGPIATRWKLIHQDYSQGQQFADFQIFGPLRYWHHLHSFCSLGSRTGNLKETIQFEVPFGRLGRWLTEKKIKRTLNRLFTYRHTVTENDLNHLINFRDQSRRKVVITGGNGLIGSDLAIFLAVQGHDVLILSRSGKSLVFGIRAARWDPKKRYIDSAATANADCWIHLAGENIAKRHWTQSRIREIRDSRVETTSFLADYLAKLEDPPECFISASGTGFYGSRNEVVDESTSKGKGILSDICHAWEDASNVLESAGIRRVFVRTGVVLSLNGGALAKLLPFYRVGLGGRIGSGTQYWSWIAMDDLLRVFDTAMQDSRLSGPINATAPIPVSNREFSKTLGAILNRPAILPAPAWVLKSLLGRMADEALLSDQNVVPDKLTRMGFSFNFPELDLALSHSLGVY